MGDEPREDHTAQTDEEKGQTTTIPQSICPGMKPGEELVLHIDQVTDDEYVVSYAPEPEKKEGDETPPPKPTAPAPRDSEMASMME